MSDINISKNGGIIKVTYSGKNPIRILAKASFLNDSEIKVIDFDGPGFKEIICDSNIWSNGSINTITCPLNKNVIAYIQPMTSSRCYHLGPCQYFDTCGLRENVLPKQEWMICPSDREGGTGKSEAYSIDLKSFRLVKAAVKYFDVTIFKKASERCIAASRIIRKAKQYNIPIYPSSSLFKVSKGK
ncbi:MAG TPA: hypothetical protein VNX68_15275 [Nitrosopumilaceae archaeon]|jgi:hypothetical protein|nr:hypothetical protein [Nitrosopumilaceae archaeon]